jgi:hypothetical protein
MGFLQRLAAKSRLDEEARTFVKFTWFGDFACSSGLHYVEGQNRRFEEILSSVERGHSDDLVENLACWAMKDDLPAELSLGALHDLCRAFYGLIEEHYEQNRERYSPDYPRLFAARDLMEYYQVIVKHSNSGGAMRSGLLGYSGASDHDHFALVGMTHLHPEAVSAAFAVSSAVQAARAGAAPRTLRKEALAGARQGGTMAREFAEREVGQLPPGGSIEDRLLKVLDSRDPCWGVESMAKDGIESHFVIPAAISVAMQAIKLSPASAVRYVVEQAISIGGDPDTIGSIGMGIVGAYFGARLTSEIDAVLASIDLDPSFIPSFLLEQDG